MGDMEFIDPSDENLIRGDKKLFSFEYIYALQFNRIMALISSSAMLRQDIMQIRRAILALDMSLKPYWKSDKDYSGTRAEIVQRLDGANIYEEKDGYFELLMDWLAAISNLMDKLNLGIKRVVRDVI